MSILATFLAGISCTSVWFVEPNYTEGNYQAEIQVKCPTKYFNEKYLRKNLDKRIIENTSKDNDGNNIFETKAMNDGDTFDSEVKLRSDYYIDRVVHSSNDAVKFAELEMQILSGKLVITSKVVVHRPWIAPVGMFMSIAEDKHQESVKKQLIEMLEIK